MIWFGWFYDIVLLIAKSSSYISNVYDLAWFYGISTIVGSLIPNPLYICIKYMICKHFADKILKRAYAHFPHSSMVSSIAMKQ